MHNSPMASLFLYPMSMRDFSAKENHMGSSAGCKRRIGIFLLDFPSLKTEILSWRAGGSVGASASLVLLVHRRAVSLRAQARAGLCPGSPAGSEQEGLCSCLAAESQCWEVFSCHGILGEPLSSVPGCPACSHYKAIFQECFALDFQSFTFSKTQVVEIMEIIKTNGDKTPKGKQAGPSMCQHRELIFICRERDLTTTLPSSAQKAHSCSLTHTSPRNLPTGSVCTVAQGVEVKPAHCRTLFKMC